MSGNSSIGTMDSFEFDVTEAMLSDVPTRLELAPGNFCYVVADAGKVNAVFKDKCSHMGGVLSPSSAGFACRTHGWLYDSRGKNLNPTNAGLTPLDFEVVGSKIKIFQKTQVELLPFMGGQLDGTESLELLAHASFVLKAKGIEVLFDPWFTGDAYWGSWRLWPENPIDIAKLSSITHVVVTHPHPDHFNLDSLKFLDPSVHFLFPDFISQIIPDTLAKLGFSNLSPIAWETRFEILPDVHLAFLRPNTMWEDSAVLIRVNDWIWLNQVDAGAPLEDALVPHGVDLLSSSFDTGASGYPLTYDLTPEKTRSILKNSKLQVLGSIAQRCDAIGAKHFAPFAGWWRHGLEEHQEFAKQLEHTTLQDLDELFQGKETSLLYTIPSSNLNIKSMSLEVNPEVQKLMSSGVRVSPSGPYTSVYTDESLLSMVRNNLEQLASNSSATRCEPVVFKVEIEGVVGTLETRFGEAESDPVRLSVKIPKRIAELLVSEDKTVTWNHIDIGYWGRWSRDSDRYPSNFMRLLQLGYVPELVTKDFETTVVDLKNINIADALEFSPDMVSRVLGRAGLPCVTCQHSLSETLETALDIHKVGQVQRDVAIAELTAILSNR